MIIETRSHKHNSHDFAYSISMETILMSSHGLSVLWSTGASSIEWMISKPAVALPKTLQGRQRKPCDSPMHSRMLVVQPRARHSRNEELRSVCVRPRISHTQCIRPDTVSLRNIADTQRTYLSCFSWGWNSSSNSCPQMDSPPVPSPSGSPVCSI